MVSPSFAGRQEIIYSSKINFRSGNNEYMLSTLISCHFPPVHSRQRLFPTRFHISSSADAINSIRMENCATSASSKTHAAHKTRASTAACKRICAFALYKHENPYLAMRTCVDTIYRLMDANNSVELSCRQTSKIALSEQCKFVPSNCALANSTSLNHLKISASTCTKHAGQRQKSFFSISRFRSLTLHIPRVHH